MIIALAFVIIFFWTGMVIVFDRRRTDRASQLSKEDSLVFAAVYLTALPVFFGWPLITHADDFGTLSVTQVLFLVFYGPFWLGVEAGNIVFRKK